MNICKKKSSRYPQKWLRYDIKHIKNRHFSRHFRTLPRFCLILLFYRFWHFKKVLVSFFALFAKIWPKNMYHSSKSRFSCLTFFTWLPEMTLTYIMVTKHRKWYLTMQRHYPCRFIGFVWAEHRNFARRCNQAWKVQHFDFDLTCDVTGDSEVIKICFPSIVFQGFQMPLEFLESVP